MQKRLLFFFFLTFSTTRLFAEEPGVHTFEIKVKEQEERHRRFSLGPQIGAAFIASDVKGYEMRPGFSLGIRTSLDIVKKFAVGFNLNADFVHLSKYDSELYDNSLDFSSLTPTLFLEFKLFHGMHFGPIFGISHKAYAFRQDGFLSHRKNKGTDTFLTSGGFFGWYFQPGRRFYLGPRIDFYHYSPAGGAFLNAHSSVNLNFATKWTF